MEILRNHVDGGKGSAEDQRGNVGHLSHCSTYGLLIITDGQTIQQLKNMVAELVRTNYGDCRLDTSRLAFPKQVGHHRKEPAVASSS